MFRVKKDAAAIVEKFKARVVAGPDDAFFGIEGVGPDFDMGSLLHLTSSTRSDLRAAVNSLCSYSQNQGEQHWEGDPRILRYLKAPVCLDSKY